MAQVRVAVPASHLGAVHAEACIVFRDDILRNERFGEARPAGAGFILVFRAEERLAGGDLHIDPFLVIIPVLILERRLGALLPGHVVLDRRQEPFQD